MISIKSPRGLIIEMNNEYLRGHDVLRVRFTFSGRYTSMAARSNTSEGVHRQLSHQCFSRCRLDPSNLGVLEVMSQRTLMHGGKPTSRFIQSSHLSEVLLSELRTDAWSHKHVPSISSSILER